MQISIIRTLFFFCCSLRFPADPNSRRHRMRMLQTRGWVLLTWCCVPTSMFFFFFFCPEFKFPPADLTSVRQEMACDSVAVIGCSPSDAGAMFRRAFFGEVYPLVFSVIIYIYIYIYIYVYICVYVCIYIYINIYINKFIVWHSFFSTTNQMHQCIKFILFWDDTLHVSDGLSVHYQQFKTVHTAVKQTLLSAC